MKKRLTTYVIPMVFLVALFFANGFDRQAILTEDFNEINSLKIRYIINSKDGSFENFNGSNSVDVNTKMESKTYSMEDSKEVIEKIYRSIVNTRVTDHKNPDEYESQNSDPAFTIEVSYKNGKKDLIKSTERGMLIYRVYDDKGSWVGGDNEELMVLIRKIV